MPINPDVAIGAALPDRTFSWTSSDVLLYQLSIGGNQLRHTLETAGLQVFPSFGVVAPTFHETDPPPLDIPGCDINLSQVVHGSQEVSVTAPIPTSGTATLNTYVSDVWDKGKAAVIWQEGVARLATDTGDGPIIWRVKSSIFVKGEGGFGGSRGESTAVEIPDRAPDATREFKVSPQQALLYRLCGDRNPLHADPEFAKNAGFPAPILHGLCTYGIVLREVTEALLDGDMNAVGSFGARFAGVVFPGETIQVRAWDLGDQIAINATAGDPERPALADCTLMKV